MAVLSDADRASAALQLILRHYVRDGNTANLDTLEVRTMINDLDTFLEANATAINNAITLAVRNKATAAQKAIAVGFVAFKRAGLI